MSHDLIVLLTGTVSGFGLGMAITTYRYGKLLDKCRMLMEKDAFFIRKLMMELIRATGKIPSTHSDPLVGEGSPHNDHEIK
jgi:hypothetical protein